VAFLTGATGSDTVLARASLEEMCRPLLAADADAPGDSVGLSFFVLRRGGVRFIGHTGHQAGFRSFLYFDPRTRAGVIAVFNTTNEAREQDSSRGFNAIRDAALELIRTPEP
jgi:CubicO group peptidase (beta-lactamase class C family)